MARFSELPKEIVAEVWEHVLAPEDVESFARVCKQVHGQAASSLRLHRQLRDKYTMFSNEDTTDKYDGTRYPRDRPSNLLKDIIASPHIGLYVQELHLQSWYFRWEPADFATTLGPLEQKFLHLPYSNRCLDIFKDALSSSIISTELDFWTFELENGNEDSIVGLLLLAAPNVLKLELNKNDGPERFRRLMVSLATATKPGIPASLRKLKHIECDVGETEAPLHFVAFMAALPSLESIKAETLFSIDHNDDLSCLPPKSSNVKDLSIKRSTVDTASLDDLLRGFKALEAFAYIQPHHEDPEWSPEYPNFDPTAMCTTLLSHTKDSLIFLNFRAEIEDGTPYVCISGLDGFNKLKHIEISLCLIANYKTAVVTSDWPSSIEPINVRDVDVANYFLVKTVTFKIIETKVTRLPKLETLAPYIEEGVDADSLQHFAAMRDKCESAGFALRIMDEPGMDFGCCSDGP